MDDQKIQTEETLQERAERLGMKYREKLNHKEIEKNVLKYIPEETARKYRMVPISTGAEGKIVLVMEDPQNIDALNVLRFITKKEKVEFEVCLVSTETLKDALTLYESTEKVLESAVENLKEDIEEQKDSRSEDIFAKDVKVFQDAPVAKLVDVIMRHAVGGKASDVHIEPVAKEYRVRFRVDGTLHASLSIPKNVGKAVIARIKILANLKIDEKRKPQDGRFRLDEEGKRIDFRVSTLPVIEGEKVVMRVLDKDSGLTNLEELGVFGRNLTVFKRRIRDPYGIFLITGPTGSGKSTTLYAFLRILNQETTNIVTLEDPVEYFIEGINQSQIKPSIGYTFASGLRSILRQDPNVIMVGEIRDGETAELAIHSALTGHLVFSTLHTNDAIGAIPRLVDMGIQRFLLSASIRAVAAQRLVRRLCPKCKQVVNIPEKFKQEIEGLLENVSEKEFEAYGINRSDTGFTFYEGKGCDTCMNSGYKGRIAIYEVFEMTDVMQEIIVEEKNLESGLQKEVRRQGVVTIQQDGILKALKGLTTLSEIERITEGQITVGGDMTDI